MQWAKLAKTPCVVGKVGSLRRLRAYLEKLAKSAKHSHEVS